MGAGRRIFAYTLSPPDFSAWRSGSKRAKMIRKRIEGVVRKRAKASGRNVAIIMAPNGIILTEIPC